MGALVVGLSLNAEKAVSRFVTHVRGIALGDEGSSLFLAEGAWLLALIGGAVSSGIRGGRGPTERLLERRGWPRRVQTGWSPPLLSVAPQVG